MPEVTKFPRRGLMSATQFKVGGKVEVSALIRGDGVDLVTQRPGHRSTTVQLTVGEARLVANALLAAANESASDA